MTYALSSPFLLPPCGSDRPGHRQLQGRILLMFRKSRAALTEVATADSGPLWHTLTPQDTVHTLAGDADWGLAADEAARRLADSGPNELVERGSRSPWQLLWEQLTAVMVLILIAAAVLSLFLGKYLEAGAIGAIVILFALLGLLPGVPRREGHCRAQKACRPRRARLARGPPPGNPSPRPGARRRDRPRGRQRRAGRCPYSDQRQPPHPGVCAYRRIRGGRKDD